MHDVYYLILGSLAGGLAIFDKELAEEFVLLRPDASPRRRGVFTSAEGQRCRFTCHRPRSLRSLGPVQVNGSVGLQVGSGSREPLDTE